MQLWDKLAEYAKNFSSYRTTMDFGDVAEILIIAVFVLYIGMDEDDPGMDIA